MQEFSQEITNVRCPQRDALYAASWVVVLSSHCQREMHPTHLTFTSLAIKELEKVAIQKVDSPKWQQFIPES